MICQKDFNQNLDQEYFNDVFGRAISAFENIALRCKKGLIKRKYNYYNSYDIFNDNIELAIHKAIVQFELLYSFINELNRKGKKVNCPFKEGQLKELEKDIRTWEDAIKNEPEATLLYENSLGKIKELINEPIKMGKASEYCYQNAFESPKGLCSAHVRDALNHAGFHFPTTNFHAYKFYKENNIKHLEEQGFKEIPLEEGLKNKLDGDIVVEEAKGKHKYGHVQIYNSKHDKWVSDFKQKGEAMVHSSDIGKRHYFRYRPKFPGISYGNEKDIINQMNRSNSSISYDDNNDSSDSNDKDDNIIYSNSSISYPISDSVSAQAKFGISRDGNISFNMGLSISIPCIIF